MSVLAVSVWGALAIACLSLSIACQSVDLRGSSPRRLTLVSFAAVMASGVMAAYLFFSNQSSLENYSQNLASAVVILSLVVSVLFVITFIFSVILLFCDDDRFHAVGCLACSVAGLVVFAVSWGLLLLNSIVRSGW